MSTTYQYVTESDGSLPGASFREQTEAFLNAMQGSIDDAQDGADAAADAADDANGVAESAAQLANQALQAATEALAAANTADANALHKTGNETASGIKTFTTSPRVPTAGATDDTTKAANTAWVRALFSLTGGFSFGDDGKVYVDFDSMDPAIMRAVVLNMVQQGGGISVDQAGQLYVDFDNMPTDKFEAMLKSIHVPIWLTANKTFYVDGSSGGPGSDTITDGIGESTAKPFKTLQACVKYVTDNYNISEYTLTIRCKNVTTTEPVTLPDYSATSGHITITRYTSAASTDPSFSVNYAPTGADFAVSVTGGDWRIYYAAVSCTNASATSGGGHIGAFRAMNYSTVYLYNSAFAYADDNSVSIDFAGKHALFAQNAAYIYINADVSISASSTGAPSPVNGMTCIGTSVIQYDSDNAHAGQLAFAGDFSRLVFASGGTWVRNAVYMSTVDTSGVTSATNTYYATNGGKINTIGGGATYFGSVGTGYVESSTYSWYK